MLLRQSRPKVTLSLTPLIDVVFILLIFFMLASQFVDWREIDLTPQAQVSSEAARDETVSFHVNHDRTFLLDGQAIGALDVAVERLKSNGPNEVILLVPDDLVEIQHVVDVIEALQNAGLEKVQLSDALSGDAR